MTWPLLIQIGDALMPLRHTLLGFLHIRPMHGYLLRQHAKEFSWIYPMTNASIYPALHGLEEDGFIAHDEQIHNGRARKVYEITAAGHTELARWLKEPEETDVSLRDQLLLKLSMQNDSTIEHSKRWLQEALIDLRAELDESDRKVREAGVEPRFARLAMEYGADMLRLRVRYLEQVLTT
jgi:DNA-binding PadR family transcriptional regulator